MKNFLRVSFLAALVSFVTSCAYFGNLKKPTELDYLDKGLKIDIRKYFNGDIEGFAIVQDEDEKIIGTQIVKINGKWDENKGVIQENFITTDGKKDSRTWLVTVESDGSFGATGHDVSSLGQGKQSGNAAQMNYTLLIPSADGRQEVTFEDKMYLVDEKSMIMISNFKRGPNSYKGVFSLKKIN
jgi:hypothetical protein